MSLEGFFAAFFSSNLLSSFSFKEPTACAIPLIPAFNSGFNMLLDI